jgi:hypothetical protein
MKKSYILICFLILSKTIAIGQTTNKPDSIKKFGITFSGFVETEAAYDTRQLLNSRENMLALYPLNQSLDKNGKDINAHPGFNQYAMSTRLTGTITGPDAFGAKTMGYIEGDFTGPSATENDAFRLRHAYIKVNWAKSELLMGQWWHPLNVPEMIPNVISLNIGAPFHPVSRQPQVRFTRNLGNFNIVAVAVSDRDYTSNGPSGATCEYLRNSVIPNLDLQLQYKKENKFFCGIGGDYRRLTPRLKTDSSFIADESIDCWAATAFMKIKFKKFTVKMQSVLGQNMYEQFMMGGFAVEKVDTATGKNTYTNLNQLTGWLDISTNNKKFNAGLFLGLAKNLGSLHNIWGAIYARGNDIDYAYRISPRLIWTSGNLSFNSEFEYTAAAYGTPNYLGDVHSTKTVYNLRILVAAIYTF